jgi:hexosaminidase
MAFISNASVTLMPLNPNSFFSKPFTALGDKEVAKFFVASMEGYHLSVTPSAITITAKTKAGAFYGMQTLLQLEAQSKNIPVLEIDDAPAFGYRGLMLDVGRHFMPVSFIKQLLDVMAMQKMNNLHLHLTEDQGWRIEIKKYPK